MSDFYDKDIQINPDIKTTTLDSNVVRNIRPKRTNFNLQKSRTLFMSDFIAQEDGNEEEEGKKVEILNIHDEILVKWQL